jgi:uncharacterized protein YuzB (UPF0349 family)
MSGVCSGVPNEAEQPADQPRVRFCVSNPRSLAERNDLIARGYECLGCLGNCTECFETRFLEINDTYIVGESYEQILGKGGA